VLQQEHRLLPMVVECFARGRVALGANGEVLLDGQLLSAPLKI
jgi:hypothetical protein